MIRKTLAILSLIGLLLSVGLWCVSYVRIVYQCNTDRFTTRWLILAYGAMYCVEIRFSDRNSISARWVQLPKRSPPLKSSKGNRVVLENGQWQVLGFAGMGRAWKPIVKPRMRIPLWILVLVFTAAFSATRPIHNRRRRKRKKLGLCVKCGYDLRASKDRCPECGETK